MVKGYQTVVVLYLLGLFLGLPVTGLAQAPDKVDENNEERNTVLEDLVVS
jgi:hypothetical protein